MLRKIQPGAERLGGIAGQRGKTEEDVDEYQKLADEELIQKLRGGDERIISLKSTSRWCFVRQMQCF